MKFELIECFTNSKFKFDLKILFKFLIQKNTKNSQATPTAFALNLKDADPGVTVDVTVVGCDLRLRFCLFWVLKLLILIFLSVKKIPVKKFKY